MIVHIITHAGIPAIYLTKIFENRYVAAATFYILKMMLMALVLVPIFTNVSLSDTLYYLFGMPFIFIFGTIPFTVYEYSIATLGEGYRFFFAFIGIIYWLIMFVSIFMIVLKLAEVRNVLSVEEKTKERRSNYKDDTELTPKELQDRNEMKRELERKNEEFMARMESERRFEEFNPSSVVTKQSVPDPEYTGYFSDNFKSDPNDDLLVFGLTTNAEIIDAEVQANAIAKAFRK